MQKGFRNYVSEHYRVRLLLSVPQLGIILVDVVTCTSLFARSDVPEVAGDRLRIWPRLFEFWSWGLILRQKRVYLHSRLLI